MNIIDKKYPRNVQPTPTVPPGALASERHPLDGSQFHNVIEEQVYSELPPTPEEQIPHRAGHLPEPDPSPPDKPTLSIGPS
jgi:hypothetical protein